MELACSCPLCTLCCALCWWHDCPAHLDTTLALSLPVGWSCMCQHGVSAVSPEPCLALGVSVTVVVTTECRCHSLCQVLQHPSYRGFGQLTPLP